MTDSPLPETADKKTFLQSVRPFFTRPALAMILLGFSSGLPLSLIFDTLSSWLRTAELSLTEISYFSLATFAYSLKFVWAPVLDRVGLPGLTTWLGHRRGWILVTQAFIMLGLWLISGLNPKEHLGFMALIAVLIGFAGATQDIVIDAWRIETAGESGERQGIMATCHAWGARVAPFVAGIVTLVLAEWIGWGFAYAVMAASMGLGIAGVLIAPRGGAHTVRPIDYGHAIARPGTEAAEWVGRLLLMFVAVCLMGAGLTANIDLFRWAFPSAEAFDAVKAVWSNRATGIFLQLPAVLLGLTLITLACIPLPGTPTRPGAYLRQTFVVPIQTFFARYENLAWLIIATICLYRVSDFVLTVNNAFYIDLGFGLTEIAAVRKIYGVLVTIAGVSLAGVTMARFGIKTSLVVGAIVCGASNIAYAWLATQGNDITAFSITLGIDNASGGFAGTVLIAYMSSLISKGYAAQQYALFTSLYALPGKLLASQSGKIVESAATAADTGGFSLKSWFAHLPDVSYTKPAQLLGVTREALGTGYIVFFTYTSLIGIAAIGLSLWLITVQRHKDEADEAA